MIYNQDASNPPPHATGQGHARIPHARAAGQEGREAARAGLPRTRAPAASLARDAADEPELPLADSLRPRGPVQLGLAQYQRGDATVVTVAGELDILTAPKFSAFVGELVRRRVGDLVIDLSEARFVDSAGLQILLSAQRRVSRHARWLAVICPPSAVRRVMELARLTEALAVVSTFEEYEAGLRGPGPAA